MHWLWSGFMWIRHIQYTPISSTSAHSFEIIPKTTTRTTSHKKAAHSIWELSSFSFCVAICVLCVCVCCALNWSHVLHYSLASISTPTSNQFQIYKYVYSAPVFILIISLCHSIRYFNGKQNWNMSCYLLVDQLSWVHCICHQYDMRCCGSFWPNINNKNLQLTEKKRTRHNK